MRVFRGHRVANFSVADFRFFLYFFEDASTILRYAHFILQNAQFNSKYVQFDLKQVRFSLRYLIFDT